jgi:thiol-disulfide isomerase/thioredoxin
MARKSLIVAATAYILLASVPLCCQSFTTTQELHPTISKRRNTSSSHLQMIFRELVSNDEDDLRVDIASIQKKDGLEKFLKQDDRLCVIKLYAPFCKACKAFGKKFRKLAIDRGDAINSIGEIARHGDARFGEIEYSSNTQLMKDLGIKKFPTVVIYRGSEMLSEITCKNDAIEKITAQMDEHLSLR